MIREVQSQQQSSVHRRLLEAHLPRPQEATIPFSFLSISLFYQNSEIKSDNNPDPE